MGTRQDSPKLVIYQHRNRRIFAYPPKDYEECRKTVLEESQGDVLDLNDDGELDFYVWDSASRTARKEKQVFLARKQDIWTAVVSGLPSGSVIYVRPRGGGKSKTWRAWLGRINRKGTEAEAVAEIEKHTTGSAVTNQSRSGSLGVHVAGNRASSNSEAGVTVT